MLKKKERLTRAEFDRFFSVGKRLHGTYIQLIFAPSETFHCSVVVGKKVFKKAVERNTLRRQIYATVASFKSTTALDYAFIVVVKPQAKAVQNAIVRNELLSLLSRV